MVDCLILSHRPFLFRDIKINSQTFIALRIWSLIKQDPLVYLFLFILFPFHLKMYRFGNERFLSSHSRGYTR